jgi:hypothetical protein
MFGGISCEDGVGWDYSGSCSMLDFGISGVELLDSATSELVNTATL